MSTARLTNIEVYQIGSMIVMIEGPCHGNSYTRHLIGCFDEQYQILDVQKDEDLIFLRTQMEGLYELSGDVEGDVFDYINEFIQNSIV